MGKVKEAVAACRARVVAGGVEVDVPTDDYAGVRLAQIVQLAQVCRGGAHM